MVFSPSETDKDWLPGTSTDVRNKLSSGPKVREYFSNQDKFYSEFNT